MFRFPPHSLAVGFHLTLPLKEFLQIENCPAEWRMLDLYIFRHDEVFFYIGQSSIAFDRVWQHIRDGFKGRSMIGRFILCNWPEAMDFTIELLCSQASQFEGQSNQLSAVEEALIERHAPCFNRAMNSHPTPLPSRYHAPNAPPKHARSLRRMILEAQYRIKAEKKQAWMAKEGL